MSPARLSRLIITLAAIAMFPAIASAQKNCKKGIPCGNSCISAGKTCRIASPAPAKTPTTTATPTLAGVAQEEKPWVASSRGRTYYLASCSGAKKLAKSNLIYFKSEADAQAAGLKRSTQRGC